MSEIIKLEHLTIKAGTQTIVDDLSLAIQAGEFVGIKGPSGSGKSTVLKFLSQLIDPNLDCQGTYELNGESYLNYEATQLRKQVSYCFQNPVLFGDTVKENLAFPYEIRQETFDEGRAIQLLEDFGLDESFLQAAIGSLSGGEKQRVALVRNLLFPPKVLLLDEVTSSLDPASRDHVWNYLLHYRQDHEVTYLMVSHVEEDHDYTDRTIQLKKTVREEED
ncbi:ABC transporter ATP-binding protein [Hutsoniella sourekii]